MSITIIDIAEFSGLSKSTVSRYLNKGSVSKKSAEKIQAVIDEHNFQTNIFASKLKSNKSMLIGLVIPPLRSVGSMTILQGINQQLADYHYSLLTVFEDFENADSIASFKHLESQGVDGIIYVNDAPDNDLDSYSKEVKIPFIHIGKTRESIQPYLKINLLCGSILGEHVLETGAERIAYVSLPTNHSNGALVRQNGFDLALAGKTVQHFKSDYSSQATYELAENIFAGKPDIIACASDRLVLGILKYCHENHIKIPDDVKIASIGNYDFTQEFALSITSIEIDYHTVGKQIASEILTALGESLEEFPADTTPILHVRNSSMPMKSE